MQRSDFDYHLPTELIAQHPLATRSASRLLVLGDAPSPPQDAWMTDLPGLLQPGDLLVFNDTRVIPARLRGQKHSGGSVELLLERILGEHELLAQLRASKTPKPGTRLRFAEGLIEAEVLGREAEFFHLRFAGEESVLTLLNRHGEMPLPPYIERPAEEDDDDRYQTLFAQREGAVAAPTAGLHFDEHLLNAIRGRGVDFGYLTLHVGAGTFQPVRVDDLDSHRMHAEYLEVGEALCRQIEAVKQQGGRLVAVGTTVVRALETAAANGNLVPFAGETRLFITPGYRFRVVDCLVTNFHLPESTLLMLVCAFAGHARVMQAYRHAVDQRYRFFSYGDACLFTRQPDKLVSSA